MTEDTSTPTGKRRTEADVVKELTPDQFQLLRRVLEIERSKLHLGAAEVPEELLEAVRGILP
jgi:hypothetical protein